jgi:peptidyl-prolyl cis-trans isomerase B (cyclophilin B)
MQELPTSVNRGPLGLALAAVVLGCAGPSDFVEIARLEEVRDRAGAELVHYLESPLAAVRARAARAAARIESGANVPGLLRVLADGNESDPSVIVETAFALGQIALSDPSLRETIGAALSDRVSDSAEVPEPARSAIAAALGKSAGPRVEATLVRLLADADGAVRGAAALGLARHRDPAIVPQLLPLIGDPSPDVRWRACYAAMCCGPDGAVDALVRALDDSSEAVRAAACRALGRAGSPAAVRALSDHLAQGEWDPSVHVAAILSLGRAEPAGPHPVLLDRVHAPSPPARAAAAVALQADLGESAGRALAFLARDESAFVRGYAALALGARPRPGAQQILVEMTGDESAFVRIHAIESLGAFPGARSYLLDLLDHPDASARAAAVRALARMSDVGALPRLCACIGDRDVRVSADAISAVDALTRSRAGGPAPCNEPAARGGADYFARLYRPHADRLVRLRLADALLARTGEDSRCAMLPLTRDPDYAIRWRVFQAFLQRDLPGETRCPLPDARVVLSDPAGASWTRRPPDVDGLPVRAEITTDHGRFVIHLLPHDAPRTIENFARLARSGFFDGLTFYAVAPDSVAVTGCPRGDGAGGPGYAIRCEINPNPIVRGAVAMAHAGRDTGGSQFFIALAPEPALDGVHTVFGYVESGMSAVDRLKAGDRILEVVIG